MALDAVFLRAVVEELKPQLSGIRIEKIFQPARDQIILFLRGNQRLLLCAGANAPRIQFTRTPRENPASPPRFCMLLRKHLSGGRILDIIQPPLERLVRLELETSDELGLSGHRTLILEAMGRRSNLILLDETGRIIDCLYRIDADMSPDRQILPGLFYLPPPSGTRIPITDETDAALTDRLFHAPAEERLETFLLNQYFGISPLLAREIVFRASGETDTRLCDLDAAAYERFRKEFARFQNAVTECRFTPVCLYRKGIPFEFTCLPVLQYGPGVECRTHTDFSGMLDTFYEERERRERIRVRSAELLRTVSTARDRIRRKLANQEKEYAAARNRDIYRKNGDLITANLYRMESGQNTLECEDFYSETGETVTIALDPQLSPQQNAAKYYKRYNKAKSAEKYLREQIDLARQDLQWLESVQEELERGESEQDFQEIRMELRENGFLRGAGKDVRNGKDQHSGKNTRGEKDQRGGNAKSAGNAKSGGKSSRKRETKLSGKPIEYSVSGGFQVFAGRNNHQNDRLTKNAERHDLWFHTQKIHGAHVILRTEGRQPDETAIAQAAAIAAYYSQARNSTKVPVDYTPVRYVRKPAGARPGMVIYTTYSTISVTPQLPESNSPLH